jgi:secretion/DNA translocation related TadE-like protein
VKCDVVRRGAEAQRGAATLLLLAVVGWAVVVTALGIGISRVALARVHVSSAADLAALAAAEASDCGRAGEVARANRAHLMDCEVLGQDVQVNVALDVRVAGRLIRLTAEARAGPP